MTGVAEAMNTMPKMMRADRRQHRGFTLIELIVVISIIAILAAVALPRLIDVQREARVAKAYSTFGLIRSSAALGHSRCLLDLSSVAPSVTASNCKSVPPAINMEGTMIRIANQYPAATVDGIDAAAQINVSADALIVGSSASGVTTRTYDVAGGTVPFCRVSYQEATLSGSTIVVAPVINVVTTGC
jgi:MSHA pilin protein MshA